MYARLFFQQVRMINESIRQFSTELESEHTDLITLVQGMIQNISDKIENLNAQFTSLRENVTNLQSKLPQPVPLLWSGTATVNSWNTIVSGSCAGSSSCFNGSYTSALADGAYILVINETSTNLASPSFYGLWRERIVSAPFAWENGITNSLNVNAFSSHQTGHANSAETTGSGQEIISFRTKRNVQNGNPNTVELQFSTNVAWSSSVTMHIMAIPVYIDSLF